MRACVHHRRGLGQRFRAFARSVRVSDRNSFVRGCLFVQGWEDNQFEPSATSTAPDANNVITWEGPDLPQEVRASQNQPHTCVRARVCVCVCVCVQQTRAPSVFGWGSDALIDCVGDSAEYSHVRRTTHTNHHYWQAPPGGLRQTIVGTHHRSNGCPYGTSQDYDRGIPTGASPCQGEYVCMYALRPNRCCV